MEFQISGCATLQTPRVRLVPVGNEATLAQAFELLAVPDIKAGLAFPPTISIRQFAERLKAKAAFPFYLLIPHGSDQAIGMVVYWDNTPANRCGQIVYAIHPDFRGQGYALGASRALLNHLFTQRSVQGVGAYVDQGNAASRRILERLGMRAVGYGRTNMIFYFVGRERYQPASLDRLIQRVDWSKSHGRVAQLAGALYGLMITRMGL